MADQSIEGQNMESDVIRITHYINPHMFWYKYDRGILDNEMLVKLEYNMQEYYFEEHKRNNTVSYNSGYEAAEKEMIAVFIINLSKWIRAEVDCILNYPNSETKYMLWSSDHGIPHQSAAKWIRKLPGHFQMVKVNGALYGGLYSVVPAEKKFNYGNGKTEFTINNEWSNGATEQMRELLSEAANIKFIPQVPYVANGSPLQNFGSIKIDLFSGQQISMSNILIDIGLAMHSNQFYEDLNNINTTKIERWYTNERKPALNCSKNTFSNYPNRQVEKKPSGETDLMKMSVDLKINDWYHRNKQLQPTKNALDGTNPLEMDNSHAKTQYSSSANSSVQLFPPLRRPKIEEVLVQPQNPTLSDSCSVRSDTKSDSSHSSKNSIMEKLARKREASIKQSKNKCSLVQKSFPHNYQSTIASSNQSMDDSELADQPNSNYDPVVVEHKKLELSNSVIAESTIADHHKFGMNSLPSILNSCQISPIPVLPSPRSKLSEPNSSEASSSTDQIQLLELNELLSTNKSTVSSDHVVEKKKTLPPSPQTSVCVPAGYDMGKIVFPSPPKQSSTNCERGVRLPRSAKNDITGFNSIPFNENKCVHSNADHHRLLLHGYPSGKPIDNTLKANFSREVHQELSTMRITNTYRIQSYAWPHLMRGNSIVIVNSSKTGKTMAYLPVMYDLVRRNFDENVIAPGVSDDSKKCNSIGPVAIIFCATSTGVENIYRTLLRFEDSNIRPMCIIKACDSRNDEKIYAGLLSGCEILVTTPYCYSRFYENDADLFNLNRISHVIFDDYDLLVTKSPDTVRKCLQLITANKNNPPQIVVTSKMWLPELKKVISRIRDPILCIGAFLEAAVYGLVQITMRLLSERLKLTQILEFVLHYNFEEQRTLIVCNNTSDVESVREFLKKNNLACNMTPEENMDNVKQYYNSLWNHRTKGTYDILVCSDSLLNQLEITTVQNLIHFSLPSSWTTFAFRFSSMLSSFKDLTQSKTLPDSSLRSLILLDEHNNNELPKLIQFMNSHGCTNLPDEIIGLAKRIQIQREEKKSLAAVQFCQCILEFGKCWSQDLCKLRHILTIRDSPTESFPQLGTKVKLRILQIHSPTYYSGQLVTSNGAGVAASGIDSYILFDGKFSSHFEEIHNHRSHALPKLGDLCAVEHFDRFHRCRIIEIVNRQSLRPNDFIVRLQLIDTGKIIVSKSASLLNLPECFHDFPPQAINIRISNLLPGEFENEWNTESLRFVTKCIENFSRKDNVHVEGGVLFCAVNTIWVDSLRLVQRLENDVDNFMLSIRKEVIRSKYGVADEKPLELLREMARDCGIPTAITIADKQDDNNRIFESQLNNDSTESQEELQFKSDEEFIANTVLNREENSVAVNGNDGKHNVGQTRSHNDSRENKCDFVEKWQSLMANKFERLEIGAFYTPDLLYVLAMEQNLASTERFYDEIQSYAIQARDSPNREMIKVVVGMHCLVEFYERYRRGKILKTSNNDTRVSVFFVDTGERDTFDVADLLAMPQSLLRHPYQAIRCKLVGIMSSTNGEWPEDVCDRIYNEIIDLCKIINGREIRFRSESNENEDLPKLITSDNDFYEVVLYDNTTDINVSINELIVENGLACYNPETRHYIDIFKSIDVLNENDCSIEFSLAELSEICQIPYDRLVQWQNHSATKDGDANISDSIKNCDENELSEKQGSHTEQRTANITELIENCEQNESADELPDLLAESSQLDESIDSNGTEWNPEKSQMPLLVSLIQKHPSVLWQQTNSLIVLTIKAVDVQDYFLKVSLRSVQFVAKFEEGNRCFVLNLLGCVVPKLCSHNLRGLNIIVRMPKVNVGMEWSSLTYGNDRVTWIRYNYDALSVDDELKLLGGPDNKALCLGNDNNSDSDDNGDGGDFDGSDSDNDEMQCNQDSYYSAIEMN